MSSYMFYCLVFLNLIIPLIIFIYRKQVFMFSTTKFVRMIGIGICLIGTKLIYHHVIVGLKLFPKNTSIREFLTKIFQNILL